MKTIEPTPRFLDLAREFGVEFEDGDLEKLGAFLALLLDANTRTNLTAITDPGAAWEKHVFDSLTLLPATAEMDTGAEAADIGSGGGAPVIPLAICRPDLRFLAIEATGKKATYLRETTAALKLANLEIVNRRAEELGQDRAFRERFALVTARAVGPLSVVAELGAPLVAVGGALVVIKGAKADEELDASQEALGKLGVTEAEISATPTGRVVTLRKGARTPRVYPRRPGEPKRRPL